MLIEFSFSNYRSFRGKNTLSLESLKKKKGLLPLVAIYGKNGGGKSNLIRAFWLAVKFICNAQMTQGAGVLVPVDPFKLNDYSTETPTSFEFIYKYKGIKYIYGFSATKEKICEEYLYHYPKGFRAQVFKRTGQEFSFIQDKAFKQLISKAVAENQLYFSVANTMNESVCAEAMKFFTESIVFSREFEDLPGQIRLNYHNNNVLKSMKQYAQRADVGITDMKFEMKNTEIDVDDTIPEDAPPELSRALKSFVSALSDNSQVKIQRNEIKARTYHTGISKNGEISQYELGLEDESDGTLRLMALAAAIDRTIDNGGIFVADELEKGLHPLLTEYIVNKFQNSEINKNNAQLIFTTHDTEIMRQHFLDADQFYFVDKDRQTGESELYSVDGLGKKNNADIRTGYLIGKFGGVPELGDE
ncbi:AAA family ATPase [Ruminococcus sp.]|jgi:AAA15 family ATPase/GTPase|nr:ATP-binding protein [Ruminococcus sp.]MCC2217046.1 ATP-binding protein [Hominimerdicola aceti]MEE0470784.1 ATP-binding protein [Ruminococcus sp.]